MKECERCGEDFLPNRFTPYQKYCGKCKGKKSKSKTAQRHIHLIGKAKPNRMLVARNWEGNPEAVYWIYGDGYYHIMPDKTYTIYKDGKPVGVVTDPHVKKLLREVQNDRKRREATNLQNRLVEVS